MNLYINQQTVMFPLHKCKLGLLSQDQSIYQLSLNLVYIFNLDILYTLFTPYTKKQLISIVHYLSFLYYFS